MTVPWMKEMVARSWRMRLAALLSIRGGTPGKAERQRVNGRECERISYIDASGKPIGELWIVGGAGHAWSGGSSLGTYTDHSGPDASREMIRFFHSHVQGVGRAS